MSDERQQDAANEFVCTWFECTDWAAPIVRESARGLDEVQFAWADSTDSIETIGALAVALGAADLPDEMSAEAYFEEICRIYRLRDFIDEFDEFDFDEELTSTRIEDAHRIAAQMMATQAKSRVFGVFEQAAKEAFMENLGR